MDIKQLQAFLAVVDHGSFSAAAEALFTVQSNISAHIAHLEAELGTTVIERRSRAVTNAGQAVERRARTIVAELRGIEDDIAELEDRIIGDVTVGTTPSIGRWILPPALMGARSSLPDVTVTVVEAQSDELNRQLISGAVDVALTTGALAAINPALDELPLLEEEIVAVLSPRHALADQERLDIAELVAHDLLIPLPDNPLHTHLQHSFERAGVQPDHVMEIGSSALTIALAAADLGLALVPATATGSEHATLLKTVDGLAPRRVSLLMRARPRPGAAVQAFGTHLRTAARTAAPSMPRCLPFEDLY